MRLSISKSRTKILNVEISRVSGSESSGPVAWITFCAHMDTKAALSATLGRFSLNWPLHPTPPVLLRQAGSHPGQPENGVKIG
jgi:hypothetical protein